MTVQRATFAAGCFWGVEQKFAQKFKGAVQTTVGYTGGTTQKPTYGQVCRGDTGHAEALEIQYDPTKVHYDDLVAYFYGIHNAAPSRGKASQYRSAIFYHTPYHTPEQRAAAEAQTAAAQTRRFPNTQISTYIEPSAEFWPAEEYHQMYYMKNGGSCH